MMDCLRVPAGGGGLELDRTEIPDVGPGDVLVSVEATSVGLTVYNYVTGRIADDPSLRPRIPGHEIVGRVEKTGPGVTDLEPGDRVGAYFYLSCDRCDACRSGHEPLCSNLRGHVGIDLDGGYAEFVRLPAANAISLPESLDPVAATTVPDAVGTPYHVANQRARIGPGDAVAVLGAGGGVGIHLVQMAQYFGGEVTAVDRRADKLERCADLGAIRTVNTAEASLADLGATFDAVVDFTGAMDLVEEALPLLAPRGRLVHLTGSAGGAFALESGALVRREIDVVGSRYCSKYEFGRAATLVADGTIEPVVTETVDLAGVPGLLETIAAGDHVARGAVVP